MVAPLFRSGGAKATHTSSSATDDEYYDDHDHQQQQPEDPDEVDEDELEQSLNLTHLQQLSPQNNQLFSNREGMALYPDDDGHSDVDSDLCGSELFASDREGGNGAGGGGYGGGKEGPQQPTLARAETRAVRSLKALVLLVLTLSAIGVAFAVYFYTSNSEQEHFESAFQESTQKVLDSIGKAIERTLGAVDSYATTLVSHARATNQSWPFVTFPDFAVLTEKTRSLSAGVIVSMHPLVRPDQRAAWETFAWKHKGWLNESMRIQESDPNYFGQINYDHQLTYPIHHDSYDIPYNSTRLMAPSWQNSPVETQTRSGSFNWDLLSQTSPESILEAINSRRPVFSEAYNLPDPNDADAMAEYEAWTEWFSNYVRPGEDPSAPANDLHWPVIDRPLNAVLAPAATWTSDNATNVSNETIPDTVLEPPRVVAQLMICFFWRDMIKDILPKGNNGVVLVVKNPCNPTFTYQIDGPTTTYLGRGDHHDAKYDGMVVTSKLTELDAFAIQESKYTGLPLNDQYCPFTFSVYPSGSMEEHYTSNNPIYFTLGAVLIFCFTSAVFLLYDWMVERRQKKVMTTAERTNAIVSSLFPSVVRDRIYPTEEIGRNRDRKTVFKLANSKSRLKSFLSDGNTSCHSDDTDAASGGAPAGAAPIAELFPDATVMFADVAGFTAWSSVREPSQVFLLLETIYGAFDAVARKRGVFKVETIGDSYVAVCGLPEPREDHAVVMARFARDCRTKMNELTRQLETTLGPDTGDLKLRFGLNSGPVTAGVLRGERSRFQLFGDTVNCAARMESNGIPSKIQVSQKTADLLLAAGKGHWLQPREDLIDAKGKGKLQAYWVEPPLRAASAGAGVSESASSELDVMHVLGATALPGDTSAAKLERLIDWNVDAFTGLIKRVVARRNTMDTAKNGKLLHAINVDSFEAEKLPRSEVSEVIVLPEFEFCVKTAAGKELTEVKLSDAVSWQLRDMISVIAYMYRPNPFHNFEHAAHVAMSIMKLLQRVVSPEKVEIGGSCKNEKEVAEALASNLHYSTYGITSDPLTQFAIVFAALIHDVDHPGVSNGQLVAERDPLASLYDNQSVAEQNSITIAWELLQRDEYSDLRACLFANDSDVRRFRQLVVNSVMATDIFDKDLKAMREARWEKAFHCDDNASSASENSVSFNRKATIVIEHLIQASDVAHTMQHWAIYQKWNRRLFEEVYTAYKAGRSPSNPADGWYNGELWFFDNYIIPLAKKLKECRVFGVACDEFLNYALDNRFEWETKGREIVEELLEEAELKHGIYETPEDIIRRRQGALLSRRDSDRSSRKPVTSPPNTGGTTVPPPEFDLGPPLLDTENLWSDESKDRHSEQGEMSARINEVIEVDLGPGLAWPDECKEGLAGEKAVEPCFQPVRDSGGPKPPRPEGSMAVASTESPPRPGEIVTPVAHPGCNTSTSATAWQSLDDSRTRFL